MSDDLERIEQIIDASGVAEIELLLPTGVRPRQLKLTTLLIGMTLAMRAGRQAFLTDVHTTLTALPDGRPAAARGDRPVEARRAPAHLPPGRVHLRSPHQRARQGHAGRHPVRAAPRRAGPAARSLRPGARRARLQQLRGRLDRPGNLVADHHPKSPPRQPRPPAANDDDTTHDDHDGSQPPSTPRTNRQPRRAAPTPRHPGGTAAATPPATKDELFYGYYLQAATIVNDEHGPQVPELARRMHLSSCDHDPPAAFVPVLERMHASGITIADVLADSGYSYRVPETWALPIRALGDRPDPRSAPQRPRPARHPPRRDLPQRQPLLPRHPHHAARPRTTRPRPPAPSRPPAHDQQCARARPLQALTDHQPDPDGYHRVICPAAQGKLRCPHRPASLTLPNDRPTILNPPEHPPVCCTQQTITVPPSVNAKTAQKHDYPSPAHRTSYNRRTAAERTFATLTDRATNDISRGWCRLMGLTPIALFTATALIARNIRVDRRVHRPPSREPATRSLRAPAQTPQTPPHHDPRPHRRRPRPLTPPRTQPPTTTPTPPASARPTPRCPAPHRPPNDQRQRRLTGRHQAPPPPRPPTPDPSDANVNINQGQT